MPCRRNVSLSGPLYARAAAYCRGYGLDLDEWIEANLDLALLAAPEDAAVPPPPAPVAQATRARVRAHARARAGQ